MSHHWVALVVMSEDSLLKTHDVHTHCSYFLSIGHRRQCEALLGKANTGRPVARHYFMTACSRSFERPATPPAGKRKMHSGAEMDGPYLYEFSGRRPFIGCCHAEKPRLFSFPVTSTAGALIGRLSSVCSWRRPPPHHGYHRATTEPSVVGWLRLHLLRARACVSRRVAVPAELRAAPSDSLRFVSGERSACVPACDTAPRHGFVWCRTQGFRQSLWTRLAHPDLKPRQVATLT
jgi:hypothetical protein